jgi:DNA polymerase-3 subunit delta
MTTADVPAPVTLVTGAEQLLSERAVQVIVDQVRETDPEVDVARAAASETSPGFLAEMLSPSLFAQSRVAVLTGLDAASDEMGDVLVEAARTPSSDAVLVLVHPGGTKGKRLLDALRKVGVPEVRCDSVRRPGELRDFVISEVRRHAGRVDDDAAARLVDVVGADLRGLASLSEQLVADGEGRVTVSLVDAYAEGRADVKGWDIADLVVSGQVSQAMAELRWALAGGTDPVLVVGALAGSLRQLTQLAAVPRGQRDADVARDLKVPPWKVRILRGQLRGWTGSGLAAAIRAVAAADLAIKGGSSDPTLALSDAVLTVCDSRTTAVH